MEGLWKFLTALLALLIRKPAAPSIGGAVPPAPTPGPVGSPPVSQPVGPISAPKVIVGGAVAVLTAAGALISPLEGYFGSTYKDVVGVETVCFGETDRAAVQQGKHYHFSKDECRAMLVKRLPEYDNGAKACLHREMPFSVHVAVISLTYNIGVRGFCRSSIATKINAGDFKGACNAFTLYNRAGGRVIQGLVNRRKIERARCLEDVK